VKIIDAISRSSLSRLDCEVLLAHVIGKSREHVFANPSLELSEDVSSEFLKLEAKRLDGCPVAYLVESKEFYGLDFYVDERVLIPRPETEMIIDTVLELCDDESARVLDVGTGSGCIAISILNKMPEFGAVACDISSDALAVASLNAKKHGVSDRIEFVESDLLEGIEGRFDFICANLPYIGLDKNDFVEKNVEKYEPEKALFGGNDGLELYKKMFQQLKMGKVECKWIIGEFGFGQTEDLKAVLSKNFDQQWEIKNDLNDIPRLFVVSV
jgi:release factor glutamine methyltransferase